MAHSRPTKLALLAAGLLFGSVVSGLTALHRLEKIGTRLREAEDWLRAVELTQPNGELSPQEILEGLDALETLQDPSSMWTESVARTRRTLTSGPEKEKAAALDDLRTRTHQEFRKHLQRARKRAKAVGRDGFWGSLLIGSITIASIGAALLFWVFRPISRAAKAESPSAAADALDGVASELATLLRDLDHERRERLLSLLRAGHLAAMGTMASSLAHEVRNPLMAIAALAESAQEGATSDVVSCSTQDLRLIEEEARRAGRLLSDLLALSPREALAKETFDVAQEVKEARRIVLASSRFRDAVIEVKTQPTVIEGVPARWRQVLINLLHNGLDATSNKGPVEVRLWHESLDLHLTVEDQGVGFDSQTESRLFDPFWSTKNPSDPGTWGGSGLGLFVAAGLLNQEDASIQGKSEGAGRGARFEIVRKASVIEAT